MTDPQRSHSAYKRERHIQQHHEGQRRGSEGRIQQTKDDGDDERNDHHQTPGSAFLVFELSTIGDGVAGRQLHILIHLGLHLRNEAAQVAPSHIRHDYDSPLSRLPIDSLRTPCHVDLGNLPQRDNFSPWGMQWDLLHR